MNTVLYLSSSRALVVTAGEAGWQVLLAFEQAEEGVQALAEWLQAQRRRSVVLLLDMPDERLQRFELPKLGHWQRRALVNRLNRSCRKGSALYCRPDKLAVGDSLLLRHFSLGQQLSGSLCFPRLQQAASRLRVIYPVALLAEQYMLPETGPGILLCSTAGEQSVRHSWFSSGRLCFTRVLDRHRDSDHFLQLLEDTRQYLHDQFAATPDHDAAGDKLVLCVASDMPDVAITVLRERFESVYLVKRSGFLQPGDTGESVPAPIVTDVAGTQLSVTQARLFDFISTLKESRRLAVECRRYRLQWHNYTGHAVALPWRVHAMLTRRSRSRFRYWPDAAMGRLLAGLASLLLMLAASLTGWQAHAVQRQVKTLQGQLLSKQQRLPETALAPAAMRDYVLLKRTFPEHLSNPLSMLQDLAGGVSGSDTIELSEIEWAVLDTPVLSPITVSSRPRSIILARNDDAVAGHAVLLRVSGNLSLGGSSISDAYRAFQQFSDRLESIPGWTLEEVGQVPFDGAGSNQGLNMATSADASRFSLLFRSAGSGRP